MTQEQIDDIKQYASELTTVSDIAVLMGLDEMEFRGMIADPSHPASVAYRRGKAEVALRLRRNELQLAEAGSPLAVQMVKLYMDDMDSDEDL